MSCRGRLQKEITRLLCFCPMLSIRIHGVTGTLTLVDSPLYPHRSTVLPKHDLFAPRLGFAYRLSNNTVIRGGYGISYLPPDLTGELASTSLVNAASTQINVTGALPNASGRSLPQNTQPTHRAHRPWLHDLVLLHSQLTEHQRTGSSAEFSLRATVELHREPRI